MVIENVDCIRSLTLLYFEDERFAVVGTGVQVIVSFPIEIIYDKLISLNKTQLYIVLIYYNSIENYNQLHINSICQYRTTDW